MNSKKFKQVWGMPILLGIISLFGLIGALAGTEIIWDALSWISLGIPLIILFYKYFKTKHTS